MTLDPALADEDYCYLTTTGRVTGRPHRIEIWFGMNPDAATVYLLAGGRHKADFVRNAIKQPAVSVKIGEREFAATVRIVDPGDEDTLARRLLLEKYSPPRYDGDLDDWGRTALTVAVDLAL